MTSYRTVFGFVLALGVSSVALGQAGTAAAPVPLQPSFRQQVSFDDQGQQQIDTWVKAQVDRLTGSDAAQQTQAREAMVAGANGSPAFADAYAKSLNANLLPVIKGKDFRAKLNASVIAARVADKTNSPYLHDAAMAMIADKNDGIVLWGVKTAKFVVPAMFEAQGAAASTDLVQAVSQAALSRGTGPIVAEAYQVLAPKVTSAKNVQPLVKATLPELLKLISTRNKAYMTGAPEEPTAENGALLFLSYQQVWNVLMPEEKAAVMQQISDLVGMAGQRYSTAGRVDQEHMVELIRQAGKALTVLATLPDVNSQPLGQAAANLAKVNASTPGAQVLQSTAQVYPALKAVVIFNKLNPPPTVSPSAPTPGPATTKSTK